MQIHEKRVSRLFKKQFQKLPIHIKELAREKELVFLMDPYHPSLRTHKLHGEEKEAWSFSVNQTYRVKFAFLGNENDGVLFTEIGTHDIYK